LRIKPPDVSPDALVFTDTSNHMAELSRADLETAGIHRPELFERSKSRMPIRVHDLRATFVTLSLADGKSETWAERSPNSPLDQILGRVSGFR